MSVLVWIVIAFVLGVIFGRLTKRGSRNNVGGPIGIGPAANTVTDATFGQIAPPRVVGSPNGLYRMMLVDRGPNLIKTIKAVREVTRLGLKDAKDVAEGAPREIIRFDTAEQAQAAARAFQGVATVRVDGPVPGFAPVTNTLG